MKKEDLLRVKLLVAEDLNKGMTHLEQKLIESNVLINEFIVLKGRFNDAIKERESGELTVKKYKTERNRIRLALVHLIDELTTSFSSDKAKGVGKAESKINESIKDRVRKEVDAYSEFSIELLKKTVVSSIVKIPALDKATSVKLDELRFVSEVQWSFDVYIRNTSSIPLRNVRFDTFKGILQIKNITNELSWTDPQEVCVFRAEYIEHILATKEKLKDYVQNEVFPKSLPLLDMIVLYSTSDEKEVMSAFRYKDSAISWQASSVPLLGDEKYK